MRHTRNATVCSFGRALEYRACRRPWGGCRHCRAFGSLACSYLREPSSHRSCCAAQREGAGKASIADCARRLHIDQYILAAHEPSGTYVVRSAFDCMLRTLSLPRGLVVGVEKRQEQREWYQGGFGTRCGGVRKPWKRRGRCTLISATRNAHRYTIPIRVISYIT